MKSHFLIFILGLVAGAVIVSILVWQMMPKMMLNVNQSSLDFDDTVAMLNISAEDSDWHVTMTYDIQNSLFNAGYEDMTRLTILSICKPEYAYNILQEDDNKKVSAIMPCRIGVYELKDGSVYVSEMNIGLMSKMFGGTIAEVMSKAAEEEAKIIESVIQ